MVTVRATLEDANGARRKINGATPFTAWFKLDVQARNYGLGDPANDPPAYLDQFTTAELDFGEGQGWQDVTTDARTMWWQEPNGSPVYPVAYMTQHTYATPGVYEVKGRMTFWDGEVIEAGPTYRVTVTVTDPGA
jgi:hypothetical protein